MDSAGGEGVGETVVRAQDDEGGIKGDAKVAWVVRNNGRDGRVGAAASTDEGRSRHGDSG